MAYERMNLKQARSYYQKALQKRPGDRAFLVPLEQIEADMTVMQAVIEGARGIRDRHNLSMRTPLPNAALYARHESMVLSAIGTLQNLSEAAPEVVADAIVPALGAALEEGSVLWAHQAPAALRCPRSTASPRRDRLRPAPPYLVSNRARPTLPYNVAS